MATRNILTAPLFEQRRVLKKVDTRSFRQGEALYFRSGVRVEDCELREARLTVKDAHQTHNVTFKVADEEPVPTCDCEAAKTNPDGWCSHSVAGAFAMYNWLYRFPPVTWEARVDKLLDTRGKKSITAVPDQLLAFTLEQEYVGWSVGAYAVPTKTLDADKIDALVAGGDRADLRELSAVARKLRVGFDSARLINGTVDLVAAASTCALIDKLGVTGNERAGMLNALFPVLSKAILFRGGNGNVFHTAITVASDTASPRLYLSEVDTELRARPELVLGDTLIDLSDKATAVVVESPMWVLSDETLVQVDTTRMDLSDLSARHEVVVPAEDRQEFLDQYLGPLAERVPIAGDSLGWETVDAPPIPRVYLIQRDNDVVINLRFLYGDYELPYQAKSSQVSVRRKQGSMDLVRIIRNGDYEGESQLKLTEFGLRKGKTPDEFVLRARTSAIDFLMHSVPKLIELGYEVYGEDKIKSARVNRSRPKISFDVGSGIDWFDVKVSVDFDGVQAKLKDIKYAIRHREKYVKLGDGTYGQLPEDWLDQYRHLFVFGEVGDDSVKLRKTQAVLLDMIFAGSEMTRYDEGYEEALSRLRDFKAVEPKDLPEGLEANLRPYQKSGYDWLHFLREFGFGGCLADDMGLGKTVQALAFLLSVKQQGGGPSLVVVPRSLVVNWQRESAKFTPSLRVLANADTARSRDTKEFANYDIVLMTYGTMLRDIAHLSKYRFHYAILDESQVIKNPSALVSRAARMLSADHRLALTGTPLENTTLDLWSQFDFLNPGLLGTLEQFKVEFAGAIERGHDDTAASFLRKMVFPFILRRTKDQVAPELPPRTERVVVTEMDADQRAVYDKYRNHYRGMLLGLIDQGGVNNARMKILEGLLRLRQIANHPKLVEHETTAGSAKLEALMETLLTLQAEGHKVLIFSQFVQMLRIIKAEFERLEIPFEYLTGQTKDRQAVVDSFQNNKDIPFFLISLKAGGVGLNLTAAGYVMHVDPWWNPAVEMQASDRTHRIGQDKPVFVYKFVVRDTVEDKILQLQERKRDLVTQIVASETGFFKSLTRDDVAVLFD